MAPPLEISIPKTTVETPSDGSKPFTKYTVAIRDPLRSYVVLKRYSEFAALHSSLTSAVGAPPPEPLPPKSWLRSTVSSPELTEERRAGLERYLRAIAEPPDRRWRDTPQWRAFLNLPASVGGGASAVSVDGKMPAIRPRDTALAAASDPAMWSDLYRELKADLKTAQAAVARKESAPEQSERLEAGTQAKRALIGAGNLLPVLREGLEVMKKEGRLLGEGEYNRRKNLIAAASNEKDGLEQVNKSVAGWMAHEQEGASGSQKAALFFGGGGGGGAHGAQQRVVGRRLGAPLPETAETKEHDNVGVFQLNYDKIDEQDRRIEELGKQVGVIKHFGSEIENEVGLHNEMLAEMNSAANGVEVKLDVANRRAKRL
ncbi:hypothetical protein VTI74DRAFT_5957 [Chaetomium olivicolor]